METNFNFNSQVCTSKIQSERLLALGLKKETADMCWTKVGPKSRTYYVPELAPINMVSWRHTPAWSLHSLIEMLKNSRITISFIEKDTAIIVERYGVFQNVCEIWDNTYENICDAIEWLIKEGYFNKEYLV